MLNINRTALLKAAEGLLSSASDQSSDEKGDRSRSPARKRHRSEKRSKHSNKQKRHKEKHRRHHKRSEQDKIQEAERKAVAIGATTLLSRLPGGLGSYGTAAGTAAGGDTVLLDTVGDANNAMFESLYAGSVPRYHRVDPLNIVSSAKYSWETQQQADKDAGNTRANRYYKGRNLLVERSRQTKRIYVPDLRPKTYTAAQQQQQQQTLNSSSWMSLLAALPQQLTAIGFQPAVRPFAADGPAGAAATGAVTALGPNHSASQAPEAGPSNGFNSSSSSSRRLMIPAPAFIPLEPPEELLKAAVNNSESQSDPGLYGVLGAAVPAKKIDPELLVEQAGMTPDEWVLKATRDWNIAVRERPHEEQVWLDFAAFQHVAARLLQQQRGRSDAADAATAEKQVSVLTRGLSYHPNSPALLLALLRSYAVIAPDAAALDDKWKGVLNRQPGSWTLWREYLAIRNSHFATFTISSLQHSYQEALHSLHMELLTTRRRAAAAHKQQHGPSSPPQLTPQQLQQMSPGAAAAAVSGSSSAGLSALLGVCVREEELELQLVQILLGLMYHELVSGHTEQVVAKIQAVLEYHLFQPPTPPGGAAALLRLFAAYWESGAARIGEKGARGWAYWCCWHAMGMEQPAAAADGEEEAQQQQQEQEPAGWTGWFEVPQQQQQQEAQQEQLPPNSQQQQQSQDPNDRLKRKRRRKGSGEDGDASQGSETDASGSESVSEGELGEDEGEAEEAVEEELDEIDLMLQLGIQLEEQLQEVEKQGLPPHIVKRWVKEEANRCSTQWQPLHPKQQQQQQQQEGDTDALDPARIIHSNAIDQCIFPIRSMSALRRLVLGSVELLGAPLGSWCSSNCPTPLQQLSPGVPETATGVTSGPRGGGLVPVTPSGISGDSRPQWSNAAADAAAGPAATPAATAACEAGERATWQQQQQLPWYQGSDDRWQLLVSLLDRLVTGGPCNSWHELCSALLLLHSHKPSDAAAAAGSSAAQADNPQHDNSGSQGLLSLTIDGAAARSSSSSSSTWPSQQQLAAVRSAAKQLLSDQQDNLLLYDAYGCCEAAIGQIKTARKVLSSALALATGTAASRSGSRSIAGSDTAAAAAVPVLALHLAQLEFAAGGQGGLERAHSAVHACLAREVYQPSAAAAAAPPPAQKAGSGQQQQQQQGLLADSAVLKARRGFQDHIQQLLQTDGGILDAAAAATVAAAALYELTLGLLTDKPAKGLAAAAAVYKQVLAAVPEAVRSANQHHEKLQVIYCHMLVAAAIGALDQLVPLPATAAAAVAVAGSSSSSSVMSAAVAASLMAAVSPARARSALASALSLYPSSTALLNLQVWLDHSCYTLAGLRRQLAALTELNPSPGLWGAALQAEGSRPGGRVRLRALFERALAAPTPLQWQQQQHVRRQQRSQALATAGFRNQQQKDPAKQQEIELHQQLQGCTAAARSVALLDLAVQDGYRGWGNCSALWEQYIQYELSLARPESARKLFLRAVHECPGFKGLWLSGFGALCEGMQPREASGLMTAMQEREVVVRTDVYEVLLADLAEKQQ